MFEKIWTGLVTLVVLVVGWAQLDASVAIAQEPELAVLGRLTPGNWELRYRSDNRTERMCLRDGRQLIQLRHPQRGCSQFVVEDVADRVTVHYTCRGKGYGRTSIRRENASLAQIQSQGIVDGLPFDFSAEARLVGRCG